MKQIPIVGKFRFFRALDISSYIYPMLVFFIAFGLQYAVAFLGLDLHHDLLMFDAASNFYFGQIPYKDFFYQYNFATLALHTASLWALGLKIASLKKITVFFYALIALAIYLCCAVQGYKRSGFILAILWSLLSPFYLPVLQGYHPWSTVYMMSTIMFGALFLILAINRHSFVLGLLAGAIFGLAFWFKQIAALQILAALFWILLNIFLLRDTTKERHRFSQILMGYVLGGTLISLPFFSYLLLNTAIDDWWTSAFRFNASFAGDTNAYSAASKGKHIVNTLFPFSRDMGYKSIIWALLPTISLFLIFDQFRGIGKRGVNRFLGLQAPILLLLLTLVGWFEYFPLPHPFHTQLFMAPAFALIGIILGIKTFSKQSIKNRSEYGAIFLMLLFTSIGIHESWQHIEGFKKKLSNYSAAIGIKNIEIFDGLKLPLKQSKSLENFYNEIKSYDVKTNSRELIPKSSDPLRAFLVGDTYPKSIFKMDVDWTWANELVEPGFNEKIKKEILDGRLGISSDSILFIQGYIPTSVLEMPSPLTSKHVIQRPIKGKYSYAENTIKSSQILFGSISDFNLTDRFYFGPQKRLNTSIDFIPIDQLNSAEIKEINNIHVTILNESDIPKYLSTNQYLYFKKMMEINGGKYDGYYFNNRVNYLLENDLDSEQKRLLGLYFLKNGKPLNKLSTNILSQFSTLEEDNSFKPFICSINASRNLEIVWPKSSTNDKNLSNLYIAIPAKKIVRDANVFIALQIEMKNSVRYIYIHAK